MGGISSATPQSKLLNSLLVSSVDIKDETAGDYKIGKESKPR